MQILDEDMCLSSMLRDWAGTCVVEGTPGDFVLISCRLRLRPCRRLLAEGAKHTHTQNQKGFKLVLLLSAFFSIQSNGLFTPWTIIKDHSLKHDEYNFGFFIQEIINKLIKVIVSCSPTVLHIHLSRISQQRWLNSSLNFCQRFQIICAFLLSVRRACAHCCHVANIK